VPTVLQEVVLCPSSNGRPTSNERCVVAARQIIPSVGECQSGCRWPAPNASANALFTSVRWLEEGSSLWEPSIRSYAHPCGAQRSRVAGLAAVLGARKRPTTGSGGGVRPANARHVTMPSPARHVSPVVRCPAGGGPVTTSRRYVSPALVKNNCSGLATVNGAGAAARWSVGHMPVPPAASPTPNGRGIPSHEDYLSSSDQR